MPSDPTAPWATSRPRRNVGEQVATSIDPEGETEMSGVYDGLTVVELADRRNQWAGKLLADGGARVIQIETPSGGPGRGCSSLVDDKVGPDRCIGYLTDSTDKQTVTVD